MITEEMIKDILEIVKYNRPNKEIKVTNEVIDGFHEYLYKTDNVLDSIIMTSINMFDDADKISADKEHVNKLVSLLNDIKGNICRKINIVQSKYLKSIRPIEEWTKEELIEHIKNKEKF